jgi:hypothetical protein
MKGSSGNWLIAGNFSAQNNNNSPASLSVNSTVINNPGYNPVGIIANPWHSSGALTNDGGAALTQSADGSTRSDKARRRSLSRAAR